LASDLLYQRFGDTVPTSLWFSEEVLEVANPLSPCAAVEEEVRNADELAVYARPDSVDFLSRHELAPRGFVLHLRRGCVVEGLVALSKRLPRVAVTVVQGEDFEVHGSSAVE
jgi:hypothetical protein